MFEGIRIWYHRRRTLKDIQYKHYLLRKMIAGFTDRVIIRIKLDEQADATLATFNQMLDDVRGVIVKHNSALSDISARAEEKKRCQTN